MRNTNRRRVAAAFFTVIGLGILIATPAGAVSQEWSGTLTTNCHKKFDAHAKGGINAGKQSGMNKGGWVSWGGVTEASNTRYWSGGDGPDRSCIYGDYFVGLEYTVSNDSGVYKSGADWGTYSASVSGYMGSPGPGTLWIWDGTHSWGINETYYCDYGWILRTHAEVNVPRYNGMPTDGFDGGSTGGSADNLVIDAQNTTITLDSTAVDPWVNTPEG
ncbi:MAG TPA: hypothetical protein VF230_01220, partial [Acidimicrobiales bacterium]